MDATKKYELIEQLAQTLTDNADLDSLMEFFYNAQLSYFEDLDENELFLEAKNICEETLKEEFPEVYEKGEDSDEE